MSPVDRLYTVSECVVGLLAVIVNVLLFCVIQRSRSLHTATHSYIAALALADLLTGIIVPAFAVSSYFGHPKEFQSCLVVNSFIVIVTNISILTMVDLTVDRYVAICHPSMYRRDMNHRSVLLVVASTWAVAVIIGLVPVMGWNRGKENFNGDCSFMAVISMEYMVYMVFFFVHLGPLVSMLAMFVHMFHTIHRKEKQIQKKMPAPRKIDRHKSNQTIAKGLAYVYVLFTVCWTPIHILNCITLFTERPPQELFLFSIVLSHACSFLKPILFISTSTQLQQAIVRRVTPHKRHHGSVIRLSVRLSARSAGRTVQSGISFTSTSESRKGPDVHRKSADRRSHSSTTATTSKKIKH
nr:hypothetical protein BaRGS_007004 [Batillaria attramentaria]